MPNNETPLQFTGFRRPNTTPVPDEIFDDLLSVLTGAELKVLLYICRRTFGFKKDSDTISLSQIADGITTKDGRILDQGTGLSKRHVQRALKSLEEQQIVDVDRQMGDDGINEINVYSLHFIEGVGTSCPYGRDTMSPGVGTPVSTTRNSKQETDNTVTVRNSNGNGDKSFLEHLDDLDQPDEKTLYIKDVLVSELGDKKSEGFYRKVAAKIPEDLIFQFLLEVREDGVQNPRKLFTHKVKEYVKAKPIQQNRQTVEEMKKELAKKLGRQDVN